MRRSAPAVATSLIGSQNQRKRFISGITERFDREGALASLAKATDESLPAKDIHDRAMNLLKQGLSDSELEEQLGWGIPDSVRNYVLRINQISRKSLPHGDRPLLPAPRDYETDKKVGRLVFLGLRPRLYRYLCDENSEVYRAWIRDGLNGLCSETWVSGAVLASLGSLRIGAGGIAVSIVALVVQTGLSNFCRIDPGQGFLSIRK